jgi:hypothetical protein
LQRFARPQEEFNGTYDFDDVVVDITPWPARADFDHSGALSAEDIFAFLSAWFARAPGADFNLDGVVTVPDIFEFLNGWLAGC